MSPFKRLSEQFRKVRHYGELSEVGDIARRYFAMNAFDGVLTIIGVLIGSYTAGVSQGRIVVTTGMATALAMGISGLWGAALTETAERKRSLDQLEAATLSNLANTRLARASQVAIVVVTLADALAPVASSLLVLAPFFLLPLIGGITNAYYLSLAFGLMTLFALGIFLGLISKSNLVITGLKTVSAVIVSIIVGFLLRPGAA